MSDEHFDRTIKTNLYGYFYMARAAVAAMKNGGSIIMTGSVTGMLGNKDLLDYSMTKGAIHAFARSLATQSCRPGHSGQCRRTRSGLDPAQSGRQACEARCKIRQRRADETAGTTRGNRAGLRVLGGAQSARATSPARCCRLSEGTPADDTGRQAHLMTVPKKTEIKAITIVSPFHTVVMSLRGPSFYYCRASRSTRLTGLSWPGCSSG